MHGTEVDRVVVLEGLRVDSKEAASVQHILSDVLAGPLRKGTHIDVTPPLGSTFLIFS